MSFQGNIALKDIEHAASILKRGGVVVFPTETAYGLAVDATNQEAIERVFKIKGRDDGKPLPLIAANIEMVKSVAIIPEALSALAHTYWPGALTLELPVRGAGLAKFFLQRGIIAIRVSSHPVAHKLSELLGAPIVSTSANRSGEAICYDVPSVQAQFEGQQEQPDLYLNDGPLSPEPASTIVGLDEKGKLVVYRQGSIHV